jgi:hypothetical protein
VPQNLAESSRSLHNSRDVSIILSLVSLSRVHHGTDPPAHGSLYPLALLCSLQHGGEKSPFGVLPSGPRTLPASGRQDDVPIDLLPPVPTRPTLSLLTLAVPHAFGFMGFSRGRLTTRDQGPRRGSVQVYSVVSSRSTSLLSASSWQTGELSKIWTSVDGCDTVRVGLPT